MNDCLRLGNSTGEMEYLIKRYSPLSVAFTMTARPLSTTCSAGMRSGDRKCHSKRLTSFSLHHSRDQNRNALSQY